MEEVLLYSSTVSYDALEIHISKNYVAEVFERSFKNAVKNWYKPGFRKGKPPQPSIPKSEKNFCPTCSNPLP